MLNEAANWLLIRYRAPEGVCPPVGIALYVPAKDELFIEFREKLDFVDPDELEVVAGSSGTFRNMAVEMGAKRTFSWMSDSLSNAIFVEGPYSVVTDNPTATIAELFQRHCDQPILPSSYP